jgi:hypothetical protein
MTFVFFLRVRRKAKSDDLPRHVCLTICLSVYMEQLGYVSIARKYVEKFQILLRAVLL